MLGEALLAFEVMSYGSEVVKIGTKDVTQKLLEDYNDVFADIVNVLLFDGEKKIKPDELENVAVHSQYRDEQGKLHEQERDVAKHWKKNGVKLSLFGLENQMKVLERMPLRVFGYEGASYRSQLDQKALEPVVTLVLYFGEQHWKKSKRLKSLLNIPAGLDKYINDINVNVFEISWLTQEQIGKFTSDFKVVANFFVKRRMNRDYVPDDPTEIVHVDEVLKLLSAVTGDDRYEVILNDKEGVGSMCEVAQRLVDKGIKEGFDQGQNRLIEAIKVARTNNYTTTEELVNNGYDQKTAAGAMEALGFEG